MPKIWLFQIIMFLCVLTVIAVPLGGYMAKVFAGERNFLSPILIPVEKFLYKIFKVDPYEDMDWKTFALNLFLFNLVGLIALFLLQEFQGFLPLNPENLKAVRWDTAINAAISFVTSTEWQSYKSESTMSYFTQMMGFGVQNFLSVASAMTVGVAIINAFVRKNMAGIGNFWVYLTRSLIYVLLPLSILLSLILISQGCVDNFKPYVHVQTLEGKEQIIAQGPAASQIATKQLGTHGGGFFTANSAHPYENPTPFTDYLELLSMLIISAAFPFTFGVLINNRAQGWALFIVMMLMLIMVLGCAVWSESQGNPLLAQLGIRHGINMEGKEVRLGTLASVVFTGVSSVTSSGAMNTLLDSLMPLTGLVAIFNMLMGAVIFGSMGLGLAGMLFYAILSMFLIGLMIGRIPEIYGKKLGSYEMVITVIALFLPCAIQLILGSIAAVTRTDTASLNAHGLTEIICAYASSIINNGSAFNRLNSSTVFYNLTTAVAMLIGRFTIIISSLAIAGSLVRKKTNPLTARFPTTGLLFISVLISVIIISGISTFFPVLVLGPVLEHFSILAGQVF